MVCLFRALVSVPNDVKIRSLEDWKLILEGGECFYRREEGSRDLETDAEKRRTIRAKLLR